jgi:type II secretory pathway pseudopilin PulG
MRSRSAYTLLEVLLSMAIAIMLLGALYTSVGYQLRQAQTGRDLIGQAALARNVLGRMGREVSAAANLTDPGRFRNLINAPLNPSNNTSGQSTTSSGSGSSSSGGASTGTSSTGAASSGSTTAAGGSTTAPAGRAIPAVPRPRARPPTR